MERIRLTKNEKRVFRMIASGQSVCPAEYPAHNFTSAVRSLQKHELVQGMFAEGGGVVDSRLTPIGRQYLAENPRLANPIDWGKVGAIVGIIGTLFGIIALFIACNKF